MDIKILFKNVKSIGKGIWLANITVKDISIFGGNPLRHGARSILLVDSPAEKDSGDLEVSPSNATVLNIGSGNEILLINSEIQNLHELPDNKKKKVITRHPLRNHNDSGERIFWVTVGKGLQENYNLALEANVWGVQENYSGRLNAVKKGDFILFYGNEIGFALCKMNSSPFKDEDRIWPDGIYPYRVRISDPLKRNSFLKFSQIYSCLLDRYGNPYETGNAAGRGIGGGGGIFRQLRSVEVRCLFEKFGWKDISGIGVNDTA